jgi:hypothetical protein
MIKITFFSIVIHKFAVDNSGFLWVTPYFTAESDVLLNSFTANLKILSIFDLWITLARMLSLF